MKRRSSRQLHAVVFAVSLLAGGAIALVASSVHMPFVIVAHADPTGIKFTGAGSCDAAQCHGASANKPAPLFAGDIGHNESSIWSKLDRHALSYKVKNDRSGLMSDLSKKIAKNLGIENAAESQRCLMCHALSGFTNAETKSRKPLNFSADLVAADVASKKFNVAHGVSCDACHGPAEKYLTPHAEKGWTAKQRAALGGAKLYDEFGLWDTRDLKQRANLCVSCHLKIDPELINASHPELPFEIDSFCHGDWMHWKSKGNYEGVKAWAMGQIVSVREAAMQLADRARAGAKVNAGLKLDSYKQLVAHVLMARHPAKLIAPDIEAELARELASVNDNWNDGAKLDAVLSLFGKTADALADKLSGITVDKSMAETLVKNVAAEGEIAGSKGYRAAQQYSYAMGALQEANFLNGAAPIPDRRAMDEKTKDDPKTQAIIATFEALLDPPNYKAETFVKAAQKLAAMFPGGVALALPPNAPDVPKVAVAAPVQPVVQPQPGPNKKVEFIFCPECGRKWPYEFLYCPEDGHALPRVD